MGTITQSSFDQCFIVFARWISFDIKALYALYSSFPSTFQQFKTERGFSPILRNNYQHFYCNYQSECYLLPFENALELQGNIQSVKCRTQNTKMFLHYMFLHHMFLSNSKLQLAYCTLKQILEHICETFISISCSLYLDNDVIYTISSIEDHYYNQIRFILGLIIWIVTLFLTTYLYLTI